MGRKGSKMKAKGMFVSLTIFLTFFFIGCKAGIVEVGGNRFEIKMPFVEIKQAIGAYIFVETMGMPRAPRIFTDHPQIEVGLTTNPPPSKTDFAVYDIIVNSEKIITNLSIKLPTVFPEKVKRGKDLDEIFSLSLSSLGYLNIKPKSWIETPVEGITPPERIKRVQGVVAVVVIPASTPMPTTATGEVLFIKRESSIWKFPVLFLPDSNGIAINKVNLFISTDAGTEYYWTGPGEVFPYPVIENFPPSGGKWHEVTLNNATLHHEVEIYSAPPAVNVDVIEKITGIENLQIVNQGIWLTFGGCEYFIANPQNPPIANPPSTTWGSIKKVGR